MIITVIFMGMMQVSVGQIIYVISVRDNFMTTAWAINIIRIESRAHMSGCADIGVYL